jgi:uncharacterized iron-regulated membrane protein
VDVDKGSFNSSDFITIFSREKLMDRRTHNGQVFVLILFVLILLVLIGIIMFFALLPTFFNQVSGEAPVVQDAFWQVNGQKVTVASVGVEAEANVIVRISQNYVGSITIKIRKDISFWTDVDYTIKTEPVNLTSGQEIHLVLRFTPDQASKGGPFSLRGYFIEVDFSATHTKWVMESSYPPRLRVT